MSDYYVITYAKSIAEGQESAEEHTPLALYETFNSVDEALTYLKSCGYANPELFKVLKAHWKSRESYRLNDGTYTYPVWANESFWRNSRHIHQHHFAHIAKGDPRLLSYTADAAKGERDIQTPIKPGRYLKQFFGDVLDEKKIAFYAEWHATGNKPSTLKNVELKFAKTPDEIEHVYRNGPRSCMAGSHSFRIHPSRVYGAGDLAVAYLVRQSDERIIARALSWPDKKGFGRVYPNDGNYAEDGFDSHQDAQEARDHLFNTLRSQGWSSIRENSGILAGARVLKIKTPCGDDHVMPYVDNYDIADEGEFFALSNNGNYDADNTNGTLIGRGSNYGDGEDDAECACCCETYDQNGMYTVYDRYENGAARGEDLYCESCRDSSTVYCHGSGEYYCDDVDTVEVDGETWVLGFAERNAFLSDHSGEWFRNQVKFEAPDGKLYSVDEWVEYNEGNTPTHYLARRNSRYYINEHDFIYNLCDAGKFTPAEVAALKPKLPLWVEYIPIAFVEVEEEEELAA